MTDEEKISKLMEKHYQIVATKNIWYNPKWLDSCRRLCEMASNLRVKIKQSSGTQSFQGHGNYYGVVECVGVPKGSILLVPPVTLIQHLNTQTGEVKDYLKFNPNAAGIITNIKL